jgi:hypothetical protein
LQDLIQYDTSQSLKDFFNSIEDFNDLMKLYLLADFFMLTDPSVDFKRLEVIRIPSKLD